ncbi:AfsR/SARP family transcriptional regulator [Nocardiopsis nanhaiensis]
MIALLLARRHEIVSATTLIEELWGENPPRSAMTTLQTYVYHARQLFSRERLTPDGRELLSTRPPGYLIQLQSDQVDAWEFERLVEQAKSATLSGKPEIATALLSEALTLWRGPAFANINVGEVLNAHATYLAELRLRATHLRIEAERSMGRHEDIIPELRSLVISHPLNESFHAQLIESLHRSGRRADALHAYQKLRSVLDRELGIAPSPRLQLLQHEALEQGQNTAPGPGADSLMTVSGR